jgi:hypothetical protein
MLSTNLRAIQKCRIFIRMKMGLWRLLIVPYLWLLDLLSPFPRSFHQSQLWEIYLNVSFNVMTGKIGNE